MHQATQVWKSSISHTAFWQQNTLLWPGARRNKRCRRSLKLAAHGSIAYTPARPISTGHQSHWLLAQCRLGLLRPPSRLRHHRSPPELARARVLQLHTACQWRLQPIASRNSR